MTDTSVTFNYTQASLGGLHCSSRAVIYISAIYRAVPASQTMSFWQGFLQTPTLLTLMQGACQQG